jgi:hypothetical protein
VQLALEVKLSASPGTADLGRLARTAEIIKADRCILVSRVQRTVESNKAVSTDLDGLLKILATR